MQRIVINACYGGFGLTPEAMLRYAELKGIKLYPYLIDRDEYNNVRNGKVIPYTGQEEDLGIFDGPFFATKECATEDEMWENSFSDLKIERTDPALVRVVEELGEKINSPYSKLLVVDIPDDVQYTIDEYDGCESIHEVHRVWP